MFGISKKASVEVDFKIEFFELCSALAEISVPEFEGNIISLDWIRNIALKNKRLHIDLVLPSFALNFERELALSIKKKAAENSKFTYADIDLNVYADVKPATAKSIFKEGISDVKNVILVASGKGGVGKSTVAANLAVALSRLGCRVGLLDADVYGPSVPLMFGVEKDVEIQGFALENSKETFMMPLEKHGIKLMSIGFLVDTSSAMIWRGPMIASASMQMFFNVAWGDLEYLIVDLPPGTGDIQLTISQKVAIAGSVIVSTPQDMALADVIRAKAMFDKVNIPTLGVVENMSYFICDGCDKRHEIFTHGGAKQVADNLGLPFLAEIPLEMKVRQGSDEGMPISVNLDESKAGLAFKDLACQVATSLAKAALKPPVHFPVQPSVGKPVASAKKGLPIL